jgi:hypothetical protein
VIVFFNTIFWSFFVLFADVFSLRGFLQPSCMPIEYAVSNNRGLGLAPSTSVWSDLEPIFTHYNVPSLHSYQSSLPLPKFAAFLSPKWNRICVPVSFPLTAFILSCLAFPISCNSNPIMIKKME